MSDRREPKDVPTKRKVPDDSRPAKRPRVQDEDLPDLANTSPVLETSNTSPGGSGINTASSPVPALVPSPLAAPVLAGAPVPIDNAQDLGLGADEEEDLPPFDSASIYTQRQQAAMVAFFRENPMFWDKGDTNFSGKRGIKGRTIQDAAVRFGTTVQELDKWFRNRRTQYGRVKKNQNKRASGSAAPPRLTEMQSWIFRAFSFLDSHVLPRTVSKQMGRVFILFLFF